MFFNTDAADAFYLRGSSSPCFDVSADLPNPTPRSSVARRYSSGSGAAAYTGHSYTHGGKVAEAPPRHPTSYAIDQDGVQPSPVNAHPRYSGADLHLPSANRRATAPSPTTGSGAWERADYLPRPSRPSSAAGSPSSAMMHPGELASGRAGSNAAGTSAPNLFLPPRVNGYGAGGSGSVAAVRNAAGPPPMRAAAAPPSNGAYRRPASAPMNRPGAPANGTSTTAAGQRVQREAPRLTHAAAARDAGAAATWAADVRLRIPVSSEGSAAAAAAAVPPPIPRRATPEVAPAASHARPRLPPTPVRVHGEAAPYSNGTSNGALTGGYAPAAAAVRMDDDEVATPWWTVDIVVTAALDGVDAADADALLQSQSEMRLLRSTPCRAPVLPANATADVAWDMVKSFLRCVALTSATGGVPPCTPQAYFYFDTDFNQYAHLTAETLPLASTLFRVVMVTAAPAEAAVEPAMSTAASAVWTHPAHSAGRAATPDEEREVSATAISPPGFVPSRSVDSAASPRPPSGHRASTPRTAGLCPTSQPRHGWSAELSPPLPAAPAPPGRVSPYDRSLSYPEQAPPPHPRHPRRASGAGMPLPGHEPPPHRQHPRPTGMILSYEGEANLDDADAEDLRLRMYAAAEAADREAARRTYDAYGAGDALAAPSAAAPHYAAYNRDYAYGTPAEHLNSDAVGLIDDDDDDEAAESAMRAAALRAAEAAAYFPHEYYPPYRADYDAPAGAAGISNGIDRLHRFRNAPPTRDSATRPPPPAVREVLYAPVGHRSSEGHATPVRPPTAPSPGPWSRAAPYDSEYALHRMPPPPAQVAHPPPPPPPQQQPEPDMQRFFDDPFMQRRVASSFAQPTPAPPPPRGGDGHTNGRPHHYATSPSRPVAVPVPAPPAYPSHDSYRSTAHPYFAHPTPAPAAVFAAPFHTGEARGGGGSGAGALDKAQRDALDALLRRSAQAREQSQQQQQQQQLQGSTPASALASSMQQPHSSSPTGSVVAVAAPAAGTAPQTTEPGPSSIFAKPPPSPPPAEPVAHTTAASATAASPVPVDAAADAAPATVSDEMEKVEEGVAAAAQEAVALREDSSAAPGFDEDQDDDVHDSDAGDEAAVVAALPESRSAAAITPDAPSAAPSLTASLLPAEEGGGDVEVAESAQTEVDVRGDGEAEPSTIVVTAAAPVLVPEEEEAKTVAAAVHEESAMQLEAPEEEAHEVTPLPSPPREPEEKVDAAAVESPPSQPLPDAEPPADSADPSAAETERDVPVDVDEHEVPHHFDDEGAEAATYQLEPEDPQTAAAPTTTAAVDSALASSVADDADDAAEASVPSPTMASPELDAPVEEAAQDAPGPIDAPSALSREGGDAETEGSAERVAEPSQVSAAAHASEEAELQPLREAPGTPTPHEEVEAVAQALQEAEETEETPHAAEMDGTAAAPSPHSAGLPVLETSEECAAVEPACAAPTPDSAEVEEPPAPQPAAAVENSVSVAAPTMDSPELEAVPLASLLTRVPSGASVKPAIMAVEEGFIGADSAPASVVMPLSAEMQQEGSPTMASPELEEVEQDYGFEHALATPQAREHDELASEAPAEARTTPPSGDVVATAESDPLNSTNATARPAISTSADDNSHGPLDGGVESGSPLQPDSYEDDGEGARLGGSETATPGTVAQDDLSNSSSPPQSQDGEAEEEGAANSEQRTALPEREDEDPSSAATENTEAPLSEGTTQATVVTPGTEPTPPSVVAAADFVPAPVMAVATEKEKKEDPDAPPQVLHHRAAAAAAAAAANGFYGLWEESVTEDGTVDGEEAGTGHDHHHHHDDDHHRRHQASFAELEEREHERDSNAGGEDGVGSAGVGGGGVSGGADGSEHDRPTDAVAIHAGAEEPLPHHHHHLSTTSVTPTTATSATTQGDDDGAVDVPMDVFRDSLSLTHTPTLTRRGDGRDEDTSVAATASLADPQDMLAHTTGSDARLPHMPRRVLPGTNRDAAASTIEPLPLAAHHVVTVSVAVAAAAAAAAAPTEEEDTKTVPSPAADTELPLVPAAEADREEPGEAEEDRRFSDAMMAAEAAVDNDEARGALCSSTASQVEGPVAPLPDVDADVDVIADVTGPTTTPASQVEAAYGSLQPSLPATPVTVLGEGQSSGMPLTLSQQQMDTPMSMGSSMPPSPPRNDTALKKTMVLLGFPGSAWEFIMTHHYEPMHEAFTNDAADAVNVTVDAIQDVRYSKGSLMVDLYVLHPAHISETFIRDQMSNYSYPQLWAIYEVKKRERKQLLHGHGHGTSVAGAMSQQSMPLPPTPALSSQEEVGWAAT